MSVKLMSAIFETEFFDLPMPEPDKDGKPRRAKASSLKLVMLALADHANDEGESSYPGLTKLQRKTALSRQGLVDVIAAIRHNGLATVADEPSKLGTNVYTINLLSFPKLSEVDGDRLIVKLLDQSSHLTSPSQVTLPEVVKSLDLKHPLTTNKPPNGADAPRKANQIPEVVLYRSVTGIYPPKVNFDDVIKAVLKVRDRLGRDVKREDLLTFYKSWCGKGYKPNNLAWLEWAETGLIPVNGNWKPRNEEPKGFDAARNFLERHSNVNS
jgi:hypothetical protein